jgi:hypothetical protein
MRQKLDRAPLEARARLHVSLHSWFPTSLKVFNSLIGQARSGVTGILVFPITKGMGDGGKIESRE